MRAPSRVHQKGVPTIVLGFTSLCSPLRTVSSMLEDCMIALSLVVAIIDLKSGRRWVGFVISATESILLHLKNGDYEIVKPVGLPGEDTVFKAVAVPFGIPGGNRRKRSQRLAARSFSVIKARRLKNR